MRQAQNKNLYYRRRKRFKFAQNESSKRVSSSEGCRDVKSGTTPLKRPGVVLLAACSFLLLSRSNFRRLLLACFDRDAAVIAWSPSSRSSAFRRKARLIISIAFGFCHLKSPSASFTPASPSAFDTKSGFFLSFTTPFFFGFSDSWPTSLSYRQLSTLLVSLPMAGAGANTTFPLLNIYFFPLSRTQYFPHAPTSLHKVFDFFPFGHFFLTHLFILVIISILQNYCSKIYLIKLKWEVREN